MPIPVVLVLGFSNIFADALAMGVGEFLSSKAENEWILSERRRENWEMENYPEGEIREMIDIYEGRGMSREDATSVIETMAKYKDFFVDVMMAEELALKVPEEDHKIESMKEGKSSKRGYGWVLRDELKRFIHFYSVKTHFLSVSLF